MILLIIILGYILVFSQKNRTYIHVYNLLMVMSGQFIMCKFSPYAENLIYHIVPFMSFCTILPYLKKYLKWIFLYFVFSFLYCIFKLCFWDISFLDIFLLFRNPLMCICVYFAIHEDIKRGKFNIKLFRKCFFLLFFIQILLAICQYTFPQISTFFFVQNSGYDYETLSSMQNNLIFLSGSFNSVAGFSTYLSFMIFIFFIIEFFQNKKNKIRIITIVVGVIILFLTGIRTPFILLCAIIILFAYFYIKKYFFVSIILGTIIIISLQIDSLSNESGAIGRMFQGFNQIAEGGETMKSTTIYITIYMLYYFFMNPFFGVSLHNSTHYMLYYGYTLEDLSTSDAALLFYLCEIGIVGIIIYLQPLYKIKRMLPLKFDIKIYYLIILFGISLSIVDLFIFTYVGLLMTAYGLVLISNLNYTAWERLPLEKLPQMRFLHQKEQ